MVNILKKIFTLLIGVVALPLIVSVSKAFYSQLGNIVIDSQNQLNFMYGLTSYVVMHIFFFKPKYLYNMGHEGVHVISTWLSFGKAKNVKVSSEGGSVETTKSNFFISLSPYFIPVYTLLLCLAYFIFSKLQDTSAYTPYFIFFLGFTLAMHIIMTVEALRVAQPDLIKTGYLFSLSLIYLINVMIAGLIIGFIFTGFSFADMFMDFCNGTKAVYILIFNQLFSV